MLLCLTFEVMEQLSDTILIIRPILQINPFMHLTQLRHLTCKLLILLHQQHVLLLRLRYLPFVMQLYLLQLLFVTRLIPRMLGLRRYDLLLQSVQLRGKEIGLFLEL